MVNLPEDVIGLIRDPETVKVVATVDENGAPHAVFKGSLTVLDNGSIAYAEALESSQSNKNMVRSIWFNKGISVTLRGKNGLSYQIKGEAAKCITNGPIFKQFYTAKRQKSGPESDIAAVWIIDPKEIRNETPSVRKAEEEKKHPIFRHLDRESFIK
ncbi:MAG: pyridoxamine 5'-phosphate oxidase family protein [Candidatus Methanoperedens sp.]|nr:pyridoxamine 5'-phosphate oxidase family protein [Candidatus Methanoperedens sp.]